MADTILTRVYSALTSSAELGALVHQICYEYPEDFARLPAVTYRKDQAITTHAFGGDSYAEKVVTVDIWSNSADLNERIAEKVTAALDFMLIDVENDISDPNYRHKNIKYFIYE